MGRVVSDAVTRLGSGVDGSVRRIEYAYSSQGNTYLITSFDAASSGTSAPSTGWDNSQRNTRRTLALATRPTNRLQVDSWSGNTLGTLLQG
jgi:hypothetical protein